MTIRFLLPTIAAIAILLSVEVASAQKMEIDYQCGCEKKKEKVKHTCKASSSPTVTIGTSANGKEKARENAGRTLCHRRFRTQCPTGTCTATLTKLGERVLTKEQIARRKTARNSGMTDKHVDALSSYADKNDLTIIVRASNKKSVFYQDEDKNKYRPKPLAINAITTEKRGKSAGLIAKPGLKKLESEKVEKILKEEARLLTTDGKGQKCKNDRDNDGVEDNEGKKKPRRARDFQPCGWYLDNRGVMRDPKKRAVYGDYDLQGVYSGAKLLETNANTKEGKKRLEELNEALDPERTDKWGVSGEDKIPIQWLIQHGANDNYRTGKKMGRCPIKDENFLVFEPDGNTKWVKKVSGLKEYYDSKKFTWLYEGDECKN